MANKTVSSAEVEAFRRFLTLLPHGKDMVLVVLKGHLLIEEQLRNVVDEHVNHPKALASAQFSCSQIICLVEAFCADRTAPWLWMSLRNLNSLRNDIAHRIEPKRFQERIADFISTIGQNSMFSGAGFGESDEQTRFELCLWVLFTNVTVLVQRSVASARKLD